MDLFNNYIDSTKNVLPEGGIVNYYGKILSFQEAEHFYNMLYQSVAWKNDEAIIFGKHHITKRKAAWYGDRDFSYTYSNTTKQALPWTPELIDLKKRVESLTGSAFNSCLLNLYHNGDEGMSWHSDDERALGRNTIIASLSLGAERKFSFKHKLSKKSMSLYLEPGSLLIMKAETQTNWWHSLPISKKIKNGRINLTFRTIIE